MRDDSPQNNVNMCHNPSSCCLDPCLLLAVPPCTMHGTPCKHLVEAPNFLDTESEQLLALQLRMHPMLGRLQIATALLAPNNGELLLDALSDVNLRANAVDAHVGRVWVNIDAAETAEPAKDGKYNVIQGHLFDGVTADVGTHT